MKGDHLLHEQAALWISTTINHWQKEVWEMWPLAPKLLPVIDAATRVVGYTFCSWRLDRHIHTTITHLYSKDVYLHV